MTRAADGARIAAIDIGTNTVLLTIAQVTPRSADLAPSAPPYAVLREEAQITRIGRGVASTGVIESAAAERTLACLERYQALLDDARVTELRVVGTSALRDAQNGPEFRARAAELLGADVAIISGAREAELTFRGALTGLGGMLASGVLASGTASDSAPPRGMEVLAFDIGGGSTEFILGSTRGEVRAFESLDVGTVRLTETFIPADFPSHQRVTPELLTALDAAIERALDASSVLPALAESVARCQVRPLVVGIAGTVTTLLTLARSRTSARAAVLGEFGPLSQSSLWALERVFADATLDERLAWPELDPGRADVMLAGSRLTARIAARIGGVTERGPRTTTAKGVGCNSAQGNCDQDSAVREPVVAAAPASPSAADEVQIIVSDRGVRHGLLLELAASLP